MDEEDDEDLDAERLGTEEPSVGCPYCGETISIVVDTSVESQSYIEDCFVCCHPIEFSIACEEGAVVSISAERA